MFSSSSSSSSALLLGAAAPLPPKKSPIICFSRQNNKPRAIPLPRRSFSSSSSSSSFYLSTWRRNGVCLRSTVKCEAIDPTVYQGVYGPWTVDSSDVREVILYRFGLVTMAVAFVVAASSALLPEGNSIGDVIKQGVDFLYVVGGGSLGLSLFLIHIYVTPIKRFLQALWVIGVVGSLWTYLTLARPVDEGLVQYVLENSAAVWLVGPLFAALTGLVFKEGLCYGKLEAGILTFIIPGLLLGHLSGVMDDGLKLNLLGVWMALFVVFAARKFQQPIKDDIGDKSVFLFNALPEDEKKALLQKLQEQQSD